MKQLNWYQIFGKSNIPDGRTVLPTDDIQIWLNCANIWDKDYITLAEVLADTDTLSALIASSNAVDYMVRSTTWATIICTDSTAMSYIGLNNYCANTLLADSTWKTAIYQSEYKGSVLNITVPKMTSNTTPSGTCAGTSISSSGNDYWKAFNSSEALGWQPSGSDTFGVAKVYYHFTSKNLPCYAHLKWIRSGATYSITVKVIGSNDGATWTEISPATVLYNDVDTDQILNAIIGYEYVGIVVTYSEIPITAGDGFKCQFYGREDV